MSNNDILATVEFIEWAKNNNDLEISKPLNSFVEKSKQISIQLDTLSPIIEKFIEEQDCDSTSDDIFNALISIFCRRGDNIEKYAYRRYQRQEQMRKDLLNLVINKNDKEYQSRLNDSNRYKCVILQKDRNAVVKELIQEYQDELNRFLDDYLDIFYSKAEWELSGEDTLKNMSSFNVDEGDIPCIFIWKNNQGGAPIPIDGLNAAGIYEMLKYIAYTIKKSNGHITARGIANACQAKFRRIKEDNLSVNPYWAPKETRADILKWRVVAPLFWAIIGSAIGSIIGAVISLLVK